MKVSKIIDFKTEHEYKIMRELEKLQSPFFCRPISLHQMLMRSSFLHKGDGSPFSKNGTLMDVCLMQYIPGGMLLEDIISDSTTYSIDVVMALVQQVLGALVMAQETLQFTHYDLHTDNIMVRPCHSNVVFKTKPLLKSPHHFSQDILVPSYGLCITIIDFGFSYTKNACDNRPITTPVMFPNLGYTSHVFNPIADCKVFLVSVLHELKTFRKHQPCELLKRIVANCFDGPAINWENGWDNVVKNIQYDDMASTIHKIAKKTGRDESVFVHYHDECLDLLQSGIILPVQQKPLTGNNLQLSLQSFLAEFWKFEECMVGSDSKRLHILKIIVRASRCTYSTMPTNNNNNNKSLYPSVETFKTYILNETMHYKYLDLSAVNFAKCQASLILLTDCIENVLAVDYETCRQASQFPNVKDARQILEIIHHHIPCNQNIPESPLYI